MRRLEGDSKAGKVKLGADERVQIRSRSDLHCAIERARKWVPAARRSDHDVAEGAVVGGATEAGGAEGLV